jgi:hypothetical protein
MPDVLKTVLINEVRQRAQRVEKWDRETPENLKGYPLSKHIPTNWDGRISKFVCMDLKNYIKTPTNNLILLGSAGLGKTALAVSLVRFFLQRGVVNSGMLYSYPEFLSHLSFREEDTQCKKQRAYRTGALILDDVGANIRSGELTDNRAGGIFSLIDQRWAQKKLTIITSNLPISDGGGRVGLVDVLGKSAWDRISGDCTIINFSGKSFRTLQE